MNYKSKALFTAVCSIFFSFGITFGSIISDNRNFEENKYFAFNVDEADSDYISDNQKKIDILHYDINIRLLPEEKIIEAVTTVTGLIKEPGLKTIDLNFRDNFIISQILLNGKKTEYLNKKTKLSIPVPADYNDTFNITVNYKGCPKKLGLSSFVFGEINDKSLVYTLNEPSYASTWFPCNDIPSDKALLDIRITNDSSKTSVSNGKLMEVTANGAEKTYHWKTFYPIATYLICLFSSKYDTFEDQYINQNNDTLKLQYFVLPEHKNNAKFDFEDQPEYLRVFSKLFGEYPFMKEKYGIAEFLWQQGAMENQTITGVGSSFVSGKKLFDDIYIHELSHHWWGDAVSPATWKDIWLNEGFATYSEALYYEAKSGFDALKSTMQSKFKRDFPEKLYSTDGDLFSMTIYNKGSWVLHMLRKETGDSTFFSILRTYFQTYKYKNASTNDFKTICEKVSGKNLDQFFKQWVYDGSGIIEADYNWSVKQQDSTYLLKLNVEQTQKEYPEYSFSLDVKVLFEGTTNFVTKTVYVDSKTGNFEFRFDKKPLDVILDPDSWLLAHFGNYAGIVN